ncbi:hypothetical protein [Acinetobacter variabilis]|uniref:hypothetical protein n=1 Tax=Acinetobacter variabilis TaxID=70346 RepID=UPI00289E1AC2|nr:hypothetical protein [Acinetobacter variabilis]
MHIFITKTVANTNKQAKPIVLPSTSVNFGNKVGGTISTHCKQWFVPISTCSQTIAIS